MKRQQTLVNEEIIGDFHLVSSQSAAGALDCAIDQHLLPGTVFCIANSLELGPLDDGHKRAHFWRMLEKECYGEAFFEEIWDPKYDVIDRDPNNGFAAWQTFKRRLELDKPKRLLVWASGSASDYIFLRMACHWLGKCQIPMLHVPVPAYDGYQAVGSHTGRALTTFSSNAVLLSQPTIDQRAQEFLSIAAQTEQLRECNDDGDLVFQDISVHDCLLLGACTEEWRSATQVISDVMGRHSTRNPLNYVYLGSRLKHLISIGQVLADNQTIAPWDFSVRLATASY
ncbi:DUF3658 domain-containing protein [Chitinimonas sp. PSY-7]|uniref:DUF3658 domain-containing protein n=1 Tax=Chitinimonas sp. PSY-7 TaxID=3459088 RepID=UPI00404039D0